MMDKQSTTWDRERDPWNFLITVLILGGLRMTNTMVKEFSTARMEGGMKAIE